MLPRRYGEIPLPRQRGALGKHGDRCHLAVDGQVIGPERGRYGQQGQGKKGRTHGNLMVKTLRELWPIPVRGPSDMSRHPHGWAKIGRVTITLR